MPKRIQRKRSRGWVAPEGAIYVGRPTPWGNPFHTHSDGVLMAPEIAVDSFRRMLEVNKAIVHDRMRRGHRQFCVVTVEDIRHHLRGKPLMCWCPLSAPCHATVLLEIANA